MSSERRREFERMRTRHEVEIEKQRKDLEQKRKELDERMERLRAEMAAAQEEFEQAIGRGIDALNAARKYRDRFGAWPERRRRRRPPRDGLQGGEPVPVKPPPKPTPLVDGAEAPLE